MCRQVSALTTRAKGGFGPRARGQPRDWPLGQTGHGGVCDLRCRGPAELDSARGGFRKSLRETPRTKGSVSYPIGGIESLHLFYREGRIGRHRIPATRDAAPMRHQARARAEIHVAQRAHAAISMHSIRRNGQMLLATMHRQSDQGGALDPTQTTKTHHQPWPLPDR